MNRRGLCLVIAAPSGAGKSSIVRGVLAREPAAVASVSATTRAPRRGEQEGVDYLFKSHEAFDAMAAAGALLEHARVFGRGYGTPRAPVEAHLSAGRDVILDIDWQGWRQLKAELPEDSVGVFILPPSMPALEERLRRRASDSEAEIARRMQAARNEIGHWAEFNHLLVNDDLEACVGDVVTVLRAARCTVSRSTGLAELARSLSADDASG